MAQLFNTWHMPRRKQTRTILQRQRKRALCHFRRIQQNPANWAQRRNMRRLVRNMIAFRNGSSITWETKPVPVPVSSIAELRKKYAPDPPECEDCEGWGITELTDEKETLCETCGGSGIVEEWPTVTEGMTGSPGIDEFPCPDCSESYDPYYD